MIFMEATLDHRLTILAGFEIAKETGIEFQIVASEVGFNGGFVQSGGKGRGC
jgi:hypothetical protein